MASDNHTNNYGTETNAKKTERRTDERRSQHHQITRTLRNGKRVHITANTEQQFVYTRAPLHQTSGNSSVESNRSSIAFVANEATCGDNANNNTTTNQIQAKTSAKSHYIDNDQRLDDQEMYDSYSDEEFIAESIKSKKRAFDRKTKSYVWLYHVKWKGYSKQEMTWEPQEHIDSPQLLRQFEEKWSKKHNSDDGTHIEEDKRSLAPKRKIKRIKKVKISRKVTLNKSANGEYLCDLSGCGFKTKYEFSFIRHKRKHKIQCDWNDCNYKAPNQFSLRRHRLTHTGEKPYKCEWHACAHSFRQRSHLNKHLLWHTKRDLNAN